MTTVTTYNLTVKISLFPTEMGGRKKSVASGYKPAFSFNSMHHYSGEVHLIGINELKPGNTANARVKLLPARTIRKNLKPNDAFTITEGSKTIGTGVIEKVSKID